MRRARHAAAAIALGVLAACGLVERADSARDASAAGWRARQRSRTPAASSTGTSRPPI